MPRSAPTIRSFTDRILGGRLTEELVRRRAAGESFDTIARWLSADYDVHVSGETVRRWWVDPGTEKQAVAG